MTKQLFNKILIANRGEIAVRVMRACRELRIGTVAVYSDADRLALHVRYADEAIHIGVSASSESYLVQDKIIAAAKETGAEAIHPGYGFLAENPTFARRVQQEGLVFIGPPAEAMEIMGDKTKARQRMLKAGVPIVPGTEEACREESEVAEIAQKLGYPVLLKAAAGGGGKGMRVVEEKKEITSAFRAARSEAESAFGDGRVYIEKYLEAPRHIEFQILADKQGHVVHLGERECSIQRRHQKIIEEAPSCILDEKMRQEMGEAAVNAADACGYENAGTIEFMVDRHNKFYFLEMNTRLQVEHPVTEMVTGIDLVKEQIFIAAGNPVPFQQEDIQMNGHAIECRIYAEDPANNFMPSVGKLAVMVPPTGPGVREDSGYVEGSEIPIFYDPLVSKLIVWSKTRSAAIARMKRALQDYQIYGIETSIPFCLMVMEHERFINGDFDTHFVQNEFLKHPEKLNGTDENSIGGDARIAAIAAALLAFQTGQGNGNSIFMQGDRSASNWKRIGRMQQTN